MATGVEPGSPLKLLFIAGIVGCAAGLKLLPAAGPASESQQAGPASAQAARPASESQQPPSPAESPRL
jgi:quaternary ammonium compound-resistance protein SugE